MAEILVFQPRRELGARDNLKAFVALCRDQLTVFGSELRFDDDAWDVTAYIGLKGKNSALRAVFSSWETSNQQAPAAMPQPFLSFAKAYFRYQHSMKPTKAVSPRISALRALCASLAEHGSADPVAADAGVFNRAAQLIGGHFSKAAGYRVGLQLEMVATFLDEHRLCAVPLRWKNPLPRAVESAGRVGEEFERARNKKLPSAYALDALARAYRAAAEPFDVVITAIAAILCSAPDRVNEVLRLRKDCEVRQDRPGLPAAYGLRYWPSKGAEPMVKWVVPSMAGVVAEALQKLRCHTDDGRLVAAWYEANPTALFLPPHLEHLRGRHDLSMDEVMQVVFMEPAKGGVQWCKANQVPTQRRGKAFVAHFDDVERAVIAMLPAGFPYLDAETDLRYSQALCVTRRNALQAQRGTYWGLVEGIDQGMVSTGLGNRSEHGFKSVFDRLGLFEADGSPIAIRSHQFRHYLNTLAQAGGMSELDIAKWSGRADIGHNSAYNHVSDRDMLARIEELKADASVADKQLVPQVRMNLIPRAKFKEMGIQAAHTTDFGYCVHDFAMSPCQLHLDCANCNEQVCIKGDQAGEANARARLAETAELLEAARAADADGAYGASRWAQHQQMTLERLTQLVGILEDSRVPVGAVIRLAHVKPASRLTHAAEARASLPDKPAAPVLAWQVENTGATA